MFDESLFLRRMFHPMDFFFKPSGIALIGASANPRKGGFAILNNLKTGFDGGIYPVNPRYDEIDGVPCYPSVADVPDPVDLAIVFVPGHRVAEVIRACADRGIRGVMIESGGFSEAGPEGVERQKMLDAVARETGIRLWGPNCMGLVDAKRRYVFSFVSPVIWEEGLLSGEVSMVVQSGMLSGAFLIDVMTHGGMGISKVCSIGNKCDVDECDLLEYLIDDPDTGVIGLYLEGLADGPRFLELCRRSPKPVVILKGGKSDRGARAAMSHTASMAGDAAVLGGALAQVGVVETYDFKQMMDICRTLAAFPDVSPGNPGRMAVLTYTGGAGIVSADRLDEAGIPLADLSADTIDRLKTVFPDWMPVSNPVDLWPAVERHGAEKTFNAAVAAVCADPGVDGVFVHVFTGGFALNPDIAGMVKTARDAGKPIFCWLLGRREDARRLQIEAQDLGMPVYREIGRAVECIAAVFRHKMDEVDLVDGVDPVDAGAVHESVAAELTGEGALDEHRSKRVLSLCGIPTVDEAPAATVHDALAAAERFGYPVVMKGLLPGEVHKSEGGLVRLGVGDPAAVEAAFADLAARMEGRGRVLVQRQIAGELELIVGLVRDPQFGPCVMCGFGGVLAEAVGDAQFAVAPLSAGEALALIGRLKAQKLLDGFRGAPPVDRQVLARILVRLGDLGTAFPQIREVDINPVIIQGGRPVAVDAAVILSP